MDRPSDKLLKDMSSEELSLESKWHLEEARKTFEKVQEMRTSALELGEDASDQMLQDAAAKEAEAQAHVHQSNLLNSVMAARLSDQGVGDAQRVANA